MVGRFGSDVIYCTLSLRLSPQCFALIIVEPFGIVGERVRKNSHATHKVDSATEITSPSNNMKHSEFVIRVLYYSLLHALCIQIILSQEL